MREEVPNWFSHRDVDLLPDPDELLPLSQTLITPDLALVFGIPATSNSTTNRHNQNHNLPVPFSISQCQPQFQHHQQQVEYCLSDPSEGCGGGGYQPVRTSKRPRLSWTVELHRRFVDAISQLGINYAVPKTIMQLMNVKGLTREKVASHLQKYRLFLKGRQDLTSRDGSEPVSAADSAMDQLFASTPVPHHFLNHSYQSSLERPTQLFVTSKSAMENRPQTASANQQQTTPNLGLDPVQEMGLRRLTSSVGTPVVHCPSVRPSERSVASNGRRILDLFPTNDD